MCDNFDKLTTKIISWFEKKRSKDNFDYENNVILYLIKNDFFVIMFNKNELVDLIDKNCDVSIDNRYYDRSQLIDVKVEAIIVLQKTFEIKIFLLK